MNCHSICDWGLSVIICLMWAICSFLLAGLNHCAVVVIVRWVLYGFLMSFYCVE